MAIKRALLQGMPGDLPRSGGLVSPFCSNIARRFLTPLMAASFVVTTGKGKEGVNEAKVGLRKAYCYQEQAVCGLCCLLCCEEIRKESCLSLQKFASSRSAWRHPIRPLFGFWRPLQGEARRELPRAKWLNGSRNELVNLALGDN